MTAMRIFHKLVAGFLIVAMLTGLIAYIGLTTTDAISSSYTDVKEETIPVVYALEKMKYHASELIHHYRHGALSEDTELESHEEINKASQEYYSNLNKYEALVDKYFPYEKGSLVKIKSTTERFNRSINDLLELGKSGASNKGSKEYMEINAAEKELIEAIDEALEDEYTEFDERSELVVRTIKSAGNGILIISLITFIMSICIGAVISFTISNPIVKLTDAAREISRGGQDTSVDIRSNDETGILANAFNKMVRDLSHEINEHKLTAASLNERNDFVKTVLESLPYPFYVIDAKDFTITLANSAACVKGSAAGTTCYALTHQTDKPCETEGRHQCPLEEVKRTGKPAMAEHFHYDQDGNIQNMEVHCYPIFDSSGNVVQAIEYSLDITERKRAEEVIKESEERFRSVSQSANDAMISSDVSGNIVFWNNAAHKIFGYNSSEVQGRPLAMLMPERYREAHQKGLERMRTTGVSQVIGKTVELIALRKDGTEFPMEISLSTWKTGEKTFYSAIMRDITERRRNEEMRRENERLALANRAKSNFLMVMSHELRTPLNAIIGFTELLKKKEAGDLNQKQQHYADNVHLSGKNLLRIIDDLLDLTRVESGKMEFTIEHVSVKVAVNEALEIITDKAGKQNIIIKKDLRPEIEFIDTDERKLRQVLNNLLGNAVKFSKPEGGTVTITAEKEGDMAKFSVTDTGIGIKEENMGRLFHSFEQIDSGIARKYGGTGLGLAVSKKLVELLGGRITAHSKYGEGSTFTFMLPIKAKSGKDT